MTAFLAIFLFLVSSLAAGEPKCNQAFFQKLNERFGKIVLGRAIQDHIITEDVLSGRIVLTLDDEYAIVCAIENAFASELKTHFLQCIQSFELPEEMRIPVEELIESIQKISHPRHERHLLQQLYKALAYWRDIPKFQHSSFLEEQLKLLRCVVKICQWEVFHPHSVRQVGFVREDCLSMDPPLAVYKFKQPWRWWKESCIWELSCLLGLSEVFMPTSSMLIQSKRVAVQPYIKPDFQANYFFPSNMIETVSFSSFLQSALGALLFSFRDGHFHNFLYRFGPQGITMVSYDNEDSFYPTTHMGIARENGKVNNLYLPVYWVFFDFPQARVPITGEAFEWLRRQAQDWDENKKDIQQYLNHPMTDCYLSEECVEWFYWRLDRLIRKIQLSKNLTVKDLLYQLVYGLRDFELNLCHRLQWPEQCITGYFSKFSESVQRRVYDQAMTQEQVDQFWMWLNDYVEYQERDGFLR
jgi:hypothetical protein